MIQNRKKRNIAMVLYKILAVLVIIVFILFMNGTIEIGVKASSIETDTRNSAKIDTSWAVSKDATDIMSALIFYAEDLADYRFSLYVNRPGLSLGYFFRAGGNLPAIEENIAEIIIEGYDESAYVSMNKQHVSKIIIDQGNSTTTLNVDSEKPFAYVLPNSNGEVSFYDINGKVIESIPCKM